MLVCEYEGHPQPTVYWVVDNATVNEGNTDYGDYNTSVVTTDFSSKLAMFETMGLRRVTAMCVAQNNFSQDKQLFIVECKLCKMHNLHSITVYFKLTIIFSHSSWNILLRFFASS